MLQCVAMCCSVVRRVAVCCSVCCSVLQCVAGPISAALLDLSVFHTNTGAEVCCRTLQCVAVHHVAVCCNVLQCVLQCVMQCVAGPISAALLDLSKLHTNTVAQVCFSDISISNF